MSSTVPQKNSRIQHFLKGVEWLGKFTASPYHFIYVDVWYFDRTFSDFALF